MIENGGDQQASAVAAAKRVNEAEQLYRSVNSTLSKMLTRIEGGDLSDLKNLRTKVSELETQMGRLADLELKYEQAHGSGMSRDEIDFDAIRRQIGCRLGRLSTSCGAEGLSGGAE